MQKRLFYEKASGASAENEGSLFKSAGTHGRTNARANEQSSGSPQGEVSISQFYQVFF